MHLQGKVPATQKPRSLAILCIIASVQEDSERKGKRGDELGEWYGNRGCPQHKCLFTCLQTCEESCSSTHCLHTGLQKCLHTGLHKSTYTHAFLHVRLTTRMCTCMHI